MRSGLNGAAVLVVVASLSLPAAAEVGPHALTNVSVSLLRAYNGGDAAALHGLLAPSLKEKYPVESLRAALKLCRVLTHEIYRFSTPVWGARRFGFFAVYAEPKTFEMILEIDEEERIIYWLLTDDLGAETQQCRVSYLD